MNTKKTIVVLAGGLGSRYNGLKQIDGLLENGSPLLEYSIFDAITAGFNKIVFIINKHIPEEYITKLSEILNKKGIENHWIIQNISDFVLYPEKVKERVKPWGTGHALLCVKHVVNEPFIVINSDDYYGLSSYKLAYNYIISGKVTPNIYSIIAYNLKNTLSKNGSVARGLVTYDSDFNLLQVEELTKISEENYQILFEENNQKLPLNKDALVSMNFWILHPSIFKYLDTEFQIFQKNNPSESAEFFLPAVVDKLVKNNWVKVKVNTSNEIWKGVTYLADKNDVQLFLKQKIEINAYPQNLWN